VDKRGFSSGNLGVESRFPQTASRSRSAAFTINEVLVLEAFVSDHSSFL
jgi:hypothetical protein